MNYNPLLRNNSTSFISNENNLVVSEYDAKKNLITFEGGEGEDTINVYFYGEYNLTEYGNFSVNGWCFDLDMLLDCDDEWFLEENKQFILEHIIQEGYFD